MLTEQLSTLTGVKHGEGALQVPDARATILLHQPKTNLMKEPVEPRYLAFRRRLLDDPTKIESVCKICGAVIVGGVLKGLPQREDEHLAECESKAKGRP